MTTSKIAGSVRAGDIVVVEGVERKVEGVGFFGSSVALKLVGVYDVATFDREAFLLVVEREPAYAPAVERLLGVAASPDKLTPELQVRAETHDVRQALEQALDALNDPQPGVWMWYEMAGRAMREARAEITKLLGEG
jgi:hypothetical protein